MKWRYLANILFTLFFFSTFIQTAYINKKKEVKVIKVYGEDKIGTSL